MVGLKYNSRKNKFVLVILISWLYVRLKWTIELSRLAVFRLFPNTQIQHVAFSSFVPLPIFWTFDDKKTSFINFNSKKRTFTIYELPFISKN